MPQHFLAPHVHLCVTDDHVVLLDLARDKYLGVDADQMDSLAERIKGWPRTDSLPSRRATAPAAAGESTFLKLLGAGMLTVDPARGKEATPPQLPGAESTLTAADLDFRPRFSTAQILTFLAISANARLQLRWRSLQNVTARVRARRTKHPRAWGEPDLRRARSLVEVFLHLRPLAFGARDRCLYDSFALIEYLAHSGIYPQWVFGVQTRPFLAHCWVQQGTVVFNDTPEYVRRFTPILAL